MKNILYKRWRFPPKCFTFSGTTPDSALKSKFQNIFKLATGYRKLQSKEKPIRFQRRTKKIFITDVVFVSLWKGSEYELRPLGGSLSTDFRSTDEDVVVTVAVEVICKIQRVTTNA